MIETKMKPIRIACVGDIMPGGVLHGKEEGYMSEKILELLNTADLRVGTLECAIGDIPSFDPEKMRRKKDVIYAPNSDINKLRFMRIDCVSLANNHAFDLGSDGLTNTISLLDKLGIAHCGAGRNLSEASAPAIFVINGKRIGFFAFCDYREETVGYVPMATETEMGMNPMYDEHARRLIRENRSEFDYLFVILHWGREHTFFPTPSMKKFAELCIAEGADGVIGGHSHRIQPIVSMGGKPIFYSLGNFLFPDRYINKPRPTFYPTPDEDTSKYPVTDAYPYVEEPTFKIWRPLARIGMIGMIIIEDKITATHVECRMTEDNRLDLCRSNDHVPLAEMRCYQLAGRMVDRPWYRLFYFIYRVITGMKNRLKNIYCA